MAFINSNESTVTRTFFNGLGVMVEEKFTVEGEERSVKYKLWFNEDQKLNEGDVISWEGNPAAKLNEFTGKDGELVRHAEINVNNAKLKDRKGSAPAGGFDEPPF